MIDKIKLNTWQNVLFPDILLNSNIEYNVIMVKTKCMRYISKYNINTKKKSIKKPAVVILLNIFF